MEVNIEGWASVYEIDDDHGDKVMPGAFARTFEVRPFIAMLFNHEKDAVVGRWETFQDRTIDGLSGLWVTGVVTDEKVARHIARGEVRGLSIGYSARRYHTDEDYRYLTEVELMEVSIAAVPANPRTLIHVVEGVTL